MRPRSEAELSHGIQETELKHLKELFSELCSGFPRACHMNRDGIKGQRGGIPAVVGLGEGPVLGNGCQGEGHSTVLTEARRQARTRRGEDALALPCLSKAEALETAGTVGTGMGQMWGSRACVPTPRAVQSCESPTRPRPHRDTGGTSLERSEECGAGPAAPCELPFVILCLSDAWRLGRPREAHGLPQPRGDSAWTRVGPRTGART